MLGSRSVFSLSVHSPPRLSLLHRQICPPHWRSANCAALIAQCNLNIECCCFWQREQKDSFWLQAGSVRLIEYASLGPELATAALLVGLTTTSILFCSHFHQIEGDTAAGKKSPLVRLGTRRGYEVRPGHFLCITAASWWLMHACTIAGDSRGVVKKLSRCHCQEIETISVAAESRYSGQQWCCCMLLWTGRRP